MRRVTSPSPSTARTIARVALATIFFAAGVVHLLWPAPFVAVTPDWVPAKSTVIALTGVAELLGAGGLMIPRLRKAAGVGLALYAVCVYPANLKHAMDYLAASGWGPGWWYHAPRLAFQPVIVWWALWASGVIDWPFRQAADVQTPAE